MAEHLNPLGKTDYLSRQHIERYRFALTRLHASQRVLDIASGSGYGTAIINSYGCRVIGVDSDREVVSYAHGSLGQRGFLAGDALDLPFRANSFDAVVSFETIEHLSDPDRFLAELCRVLTPTGKLICSTPNIRYTAHPSYHLKEYEPEEFYDVLRRQFSDVDLFAQYIGSWERFKDQIWWTIGGFFISVLDKYGLKDSTKRLIAGLSSNFGNNRRQEGSAQALLTLSTSTQEDRNHAVQPFIGSRLLRIMVVVAENSLQT